MLRKITFKNYKPFKDQQELNLKPITILIGKNSSGKSAVAKLPTLIENSLTGDFSGPLLLENKGVELGAEFKDLVFGRTRTGLLELGLYSENENLNVVIGSGTGTKDLPQIFSWELSNEFGVFKKDDTNKFSGIKLLSDDDRHSLMGLNLNVDYIGPFRELPQRGFSNRSTSPIEKIGVKGELAYELLIQDALTTEKVLVEKVSSWYEKNFEGWGIKVNVDKAPFYQIELTRNEGVLNINIRDVGQGMSQALPLVIRAFMPALLEVLIIIEQPELHLHPAAHGDLAELFVESLKEGKKRFLIETHSQNFVLRLRRLVAEGILNRDDLAIYFVDFDSEKGISKLLPINVDENGEVDCWPENIFNESFDEALAIRRAQKKRKL